MQRNEKQRTQRMKHGRNAKYEMYTTYATQSNTQRIQRSARDATQRNVQCSALPKKKQKVAQLTAMSLIFSLVFLGNSKADGASTVDIILKLLSRKLSIVLSG